MIAVMQLGRLSDPISESVLPPRSLPNRRSTLPQETARPPGQSDSIILQPEVQLSHSSLALSGLPGDCSSEAKTKSVSNPHIRGPSHSGSLLSNMEAWMNGCLVEGVPSMDYCKQPHEKSWSLEERSEHLRAAVTDVIMLMEEVVPLSTSLNSVRRDKVSEIIREGISITNGIFSEDEASRWGDGFVFDESRLADDLQLFEDSGHNLAEAARRRQTSMSPDRLNADRVTEHVSPENSDFDRIVKLAIEGMTVFVASDFVPNSETTLPALRPKYKHLLATVNKLIDKTFYDKGLALILPKKLVLAFVLAFHLSVNSWAPKMGKECGRVIFDGFDKGPGRNSLNSKEAKLLCDDNYGLIGLPTIRQIVGNITTFFDDAVHTDPTVSWDDLVLFKCDLAGAFTLVKFNPNDVRLMATELDHDRIFFSLVGVFGWTGTPAAFHVVSRVVLYELSKRVKALLLMYTDDIMGVCLYRDLMSNLRIIKEYVNNLLGPGALADAKTEYGRRIVNIGYVIDLNTGFVEISDRNKAKSLVGFLMTGLDGKATRTEMERLASYASRYSGVCQSINCFTRSLFASFQGQDRFCRFVLPPDACRSIRVVRVLILMTSLEPLLFCRSIASFRHELAKLIMAFDASLEGIGIVWFYRDIHGHESPMGGFTASLLGLDFGTDSSFQNTAEFIAGVIGMIGLILMDKCGHSVGIRGDSVSALSWLDKQHYKGSLTGNASIVFTLLQVQSKIAVVSSEAISSEANWQTDKLSRGTSVAEMAILYPSELGSLTEFEFPTGMIDRVLSDCDPRRESFNDDSVTRLWENVSTLWGTVPAGSWGEGPLTRE